MRQESRWKLVNKNEVPNVGVVFVDDDDDDVVVVVVVFQIRFGK